MSKWQAINKFKENPVVGWCWVLYVGNVFMAYHDNGKFYFDNGKEDEFVGLEITHVMHIPDPSLPGNKYPFINMNIEDVEALEFVSHKDMKNAMCAAHSLAYRKKWKFKTENSVDAGKFRLTVTRII